MNHHNWKCLTPERFNDVKYKCTECGKEAIWNIESEVLDGECNKGIKKYTIIWNEFIPLGTGGSYLPQTKYIKVAKGSSLKDILEQYDNINFLFEGWPKLVSEDAEDS